MKECTPESGRCHSVCTLWFPLCSPSISSVSTLFSLHILFFYSVLPLYPLFLLRSPTLYSVSTPFSHSIRCLYSVLPLQPMFLLSSPTQSSVSTPFSFSILCFYFFLPLYPLFLLRSPSLSSVSTPFSLSILCFYRGGRTEQKQRIERENRVDTEDREGERFYSVLRLYNLFLFFSPPSVPPSVFSFNPLFTKKAVRRAEQLVGVYTDRSAYTHSSVNIVNKRDLHLL